jgi:Metallopeptidase family M24
MRRSPHAVDQLRPAVHGLMGRAKEDLAELVSFRSVADPKQFPPEECQKAADWVVEAFAAEGLQDVTASPTPDGSNCVHGHVPAPEGTPTVLLYCHYMVEGEEHLIEPGMCFSIEPGIYLTDRFGVRIEDIVVATEDGGRRLNNTSHELYIVA